jgi:hypothetical protein
LEGFDVIIKKKLRRLVLIISFPKERRNLVGVITVNTLNSNRGLDDFVQTMHSFIHKILNFGFVWRVIPDLTFRGSTITSPSVMLSLKARINSGSGYTTAFTDPTNVTRTSTIPVEEYTGQVYTRIRGRQMAFRVDSSDVGVAWQVGAMRIDIRPDGRR